MRGMYVKITEGNFLTVGVIILEYKDTIYVESVCFTDILYPYFCNLLYKGKHMQHI